jgi:hypothetical protein
MQFKGIKIVTIPIFSLNSKTINLHFINIKYYLVISLFNLILVL